MRQWLPFFSLFILSGGCRGTPFLVANFEKEYRPKLKTVVFMPFSIPKSNNLAENHRQKLEEVITRSIVERDSMRAFIFPAGLRLRFESRSDSSILQIPGDSLTKLFSSDALLFTNVIRLYESAGSNPTTREIGASKFQRRGVELLAEFRLVETVTGKLLWRYRVWRFGEDVETVSQRVGRAVAEAWPL